MDKQMVYTLTIDHKHGTDTRVFRTYEGAKAALVAWAKEWYPVEFERLDRPIYTVEQFNELPDDEAIDEYFSIMDGIEFYSMDSPTLED